MAGGVQGMHAKYRHMVRATLRSLGHGKALTFGAAMRTLQAMHVQWAAQRETMQAEREALFFGELEHFADAVDAAQATRAQLGVVLFCAHWLLRSNHLLLALQHVADRDADADAVTLLRRVMGGASDVAALARLLQAFAVEKLQKDRCRYFDVLLYQVAFEASGAREAELEHAAFMGDLAPMLFNAECLARPMWHEDLRSLTTLYLEVGVRVEELGDVDAAARAELGHRGQAAAPQPRLLHVRRVRGRGGRK